MVKVDVEVGGETYKVPVVESVPVFLRNGVRMHGWRAIIEKENPLVQYSIVSNRYMPFQHNEVITIVRDAFKELGYDIHDESVCFEGIHKARMFYRVLFDEIDVVKGDNVKVGLMFSNSYDRSLGITINGYAMRMFCMNQMVFGRELISEFVIHVGWVRERFLKILKRVILELDDIATFIKTLAKINVPYSEIGKIVKERVKIADKYKKMIIRRVPYEKEVSLWDLYNAYTYVITHRAEFAESRKIDTLKNVNKVMIEVIKR